MKKHKTRALLEIYAVVITKELKNIYMNRATKYSTVTICVASFKSNKFEFEDESPQKSQITGKNQKYH